MLYYISNADLPSRKAHAIQQMKMCQAFQRTGEEVCFIHPNYGDIRNRLHWNDVTQFYGLDKEFEIQTLPSLQSRFERIPQVGVLTMIGSMTSWLVSLLASGRIDGSSIIYGRNYYGMFVFNEIRQLIPPDRRPTMVYELHQPISAHMKSRFFTSIDGLVCITHKLKNFVLKKYNLSESDVLVAPDGVDLDRYNGLSKPVTRRRLGLPRDENIVMYTGHLYEGKGVETLVKAAYGLDAQVYIVGGYDEDLQRVKDDVGHPENVTFTGFIKPSKIPEYQNAADVLVAPYTEKSRPWVSPLKLFEYMAAGRAIVASDREVLQEVLTEGQNAILFEKGDPHSLNEKLSQILASPDLINRLGEINSRNVDAYTWEQRAKSIKCFIKQRCARLGT